MTYDLRRLRLHGLIERVPAQPSLYRITPTGAQVAMFYARRLYTRRSDLHAP